MMSGLGGDAFYHVFDQASGRAVVFNGTGPAPQAATPERYASGIPRTGPLSVSVPGMLGGLGAMHRDYGRLPWAELCAEAIRLAREGFGATPHYRHFAGEHLATLRADRRSAATFLAQDMAPAVGRPIVQPELARAPGGDRGRGGGVPLPRRTGAPAGRRLRRGRHTDRRGRSGRVPRRNSAADRDRLPWADRP